MNKQREQSSELVNLSHSTQNSVSFYFGDSFIGRDVEENRTKTDGLTQWVATNFELLFPDDEPPYDYRIVDGVTRARWKNYADEFLDRWLPNHATRNVIRKSFDYDDKKFGKTSQFLLFPHPEDADAMNLVGSGGEYPAALFNLVQTDSGHAVVSKIFRTVRSPSLEKEDLVLTCPFEVANAFEAKGWQNIESNLVTKLLRMDSKMVEIQSELNDWNQFLNWYEERNNENSWSGEILSAEWSKEATETPELILKVKAKGRDLGLMRKIPTGGKKYPSVYVTQHSSEKTMENTVSNYAEKIKLGKARRAKSKGKEKTVTLKIWVNDNPESINPKSLVGQNLVNNSADNLGTIRREREGLERLQQLESHANMHNWIFDISNAKSGPSEPPKLEFDLVDRLNEEQEWAVRSALAAPEVYLIQGPPGTGKTTVIAELTNQVTKAGGKVLIASQTNLAVDNALGRLKHKTNVRPIRHLGEFAAKNPDPESEPFLENNVVRSFFLPAVKAECEKAQNAAEELISGQESIKRFIQDSDSIIKSNQQLTEQIVIKQQNRNSLQKDKQKIFNQHQKIDNQKIIIDNSIALIQEYRWSELNLYSLENPTKELEIVQKINLISQLKSRLNHLNDAIQILSKTDVKGTLSDDEIRLRSELKVAKDNEDYMKAYEISEELKKIESSKDIEPQYSWSNISRNLSRLGEKLDNSILSDLGKNINAPGNFSILSTEIIGDFEKEVNDINSNEELLLNLENELIQCLLDRKEKMNGIQGDEINHNFQMAKESEISNKISELDSEILMLKRKQSDNKERMENLISNLPGILTKDVGIENIMNTDYINSLSSDANVWSVAHADFIQESSRWIELRKSWIEAIAKSDEASIEDMKSLYLQIVNVHGATTALSGSKYWWGKHASQPFDMVIIDEISKATPPEIIMASLLGKKVVWVGDHRQLAPEFSDPRKSTSEDNEHGNEELKKEFGKYEDMVTTALFERHYINAHPSLKSSLYVQYRMHGSIMDSINPFYDGNLQCGLSPEDQKTKKKHGIKITKKDNYGTAFDKGSVIINPNRHIYWIDSAFNRRNQYCSEEQVGTSKRNPREIDISEELLNEIDEQIGTWKEQLSEVPDDWSKVDSPFGQLTAEGKLDVAFITFYGAQKKSFNSQIFGGGSNSTEDRWKNIDLKVDSVDRFQGGERSVVIVSMVASTYLNDDQRAKLQRLMRKYSIPDDKWLVSHKASKDQFKINSPTSKFAKSPNRVNVAYSRAQNLLLIIGNKWGWRNCKMRIKRDNGKYETIQYFKELQNKIRGGVIDGCELL